MRINRYLASCGLGSRRGCEALVLAGRVQINGAVVRKLAVQVGPEDEVRCDGRPTAALADRWIALHKPRSTITAMRDPGGRRCLADLLPPDLHTLRHAGRLDWDSEGLLLLGTDGTLIHALTHPSRGVQKVYRVRLDRPYPSERSGELLRGMQLEEGWARALHAEVTGERELHITLTQGMRRQIRRMFWALGWRVQRLRRLSFGPVRLGAMPPGAWRDLSSDEVRALRRAPQAKAERRG